MAGRLRIVKTITAQPKGTRRTLLEFILAGHKGIVTHILVTSKETRYQSLRVSHSPRVHQSPRVQQSHQVRISFHVSNTFQVHVLAFRAGITNLHQGSLDDGADDYCQANPHLCTRFDAGKRSPELPDWIGWSAEYCKTHPCSTKRNTEDRFPKYGYGYQQNYCKTHSCDVKRDTEIVPPSEGGYGPWYCQTHRC